jgi:hypothetical protein
MEMLLHRCIARSSPVGTGYCSKIIASSSALLAGEEVSTEKKNKKSWHNNAEI